MDAALRFYRDVLDLRVTHDTVEEFSQGTGQPLAKRRAVYLRWGDDPRGCFVVLDQQITHDTKGEPAALFQMGVHHFAFWVDDLDAVMARVRDAGLPIVLGGEGPGVDTVWWGEPAGGGLIRSAILRDFEGNYVQLDQRAS